MPQGPSRSDYCCGGTAMVTKFDEFIIVLAAPRFVGCTQKLFVNSPVTIIRAFV